MNFSLPKQDLQHIWQKAEACLAELNNSRIFITGGTGFFGHWLLESICHANLFFNTNLKVTILTRDSKSFLHKSPQFSHLPWLTFLEGDVRNFPHPVDEFTHVIHAATQTNAALNNHNPLLLLDTIIEGTRHVLEFAAQAQVKHFLLISSGAIYGCPPPTLKKIPESYIGTADPSSKYSAYAIGKLTAEYLAMHFSPTALNFGSIGLISGFSKCNPAMKVKIARCFAFVGPYLPLTTHFAIGNFIANALKQEPIYISGDGTPFRSYLYAADLIVWLWHILCFGQSGKVYNVGSDEAISIIDLASLIAQLTDLTVIRAKEPNPLIPAESYVPDTQRARDDLHLQQWIALPEAIQKTIKWNLAYIRRLVGNSAQ